MLPNRRTSVDYTSFTLDRLLRNHRAEIPKLARANESLQSTAHTEDTGHKDATPLGGEVDEQNQIHTRSGPTARTGGQRESVDIPALFGGQEFYVEYDGVHSSLLKKLGRNSTSFRYQNESKVQYYVTLALEDAICALGLDELLEIEPELSVFSYRPDIIVVTHSTLGIILVVEVKKPGADVFTSHSVAGQVYDYLVGMLGMGIARPFVVLTTYEEMVIAHLDDGAHALSSRSLMEEVAGKVGESLDSEREFLTTTGRGDRGEESSPPGSPLSKRNPVVSTSQTGDATPAGHHSEAARGRNNDEGVDDDDSDDDDWNRFVCYSKVVERENVLKAWMFVIRCAIQSCMRSPRRDVPRQNATPTFACARVNEQGMVWRNLPSNLKVDYFTFPTATTESFYLLNDLGRGSNGRAYLICSSGGKACVAKFYFIKDIEAHRPRETAYARQQRRSSLLQLRKSEADQEKKYWIDLYKRKYPVDVKQLHGHWCLLLPYFDPITDVQKRRECLPQVRAILEHFQSEGLKYKDDDLRWRHVGIRKGEVCLFDLGSLEKETNIDVDKQVQILEGRIEYRC